MQIGCCCCSWAAEDACASVVLQCVELSSIKSPSVAQCNLLSASHRWTCDDRCRSRHASDNVRPCTAAYSASWTWRWARRQPTASTTSDAFDSVRSTSSDDCVRRSCRSSTSPSDPRTLRTHTHTHKHTDILASLKGTIRVITCSYT